MGCGQSQKANIRTTNPRHIRGFGKGYSEDSKRPRPLSSPRRKKQDDSEKPMVTEKEIKNVEQIEINPSQFVLEKSESIYNNYSIKEKIGEGAFGIVYKAVHKASYETRAIKFIDRRGVTAKQESKLLQEISILKKLDHPHIVKLYEFYTDPKYYYLATEFVEGGELFDEIQKRKNFSEEMAAKIISQVLSTIVYCHERKIVHRDLKPENILLDKSSSGALQVKVIDFGTAQAFSESKMRAVLGTPYYIAPEVLLKNYNEKCDVWSLGVILYILLSGTPPFNGASDDEIMKAVKKTKFAYYSPIWQDISDSAKDLINKMLTYPPESRISAQDAFGHEWIQKRKFNPLKPEAATNLLNNLKTFHTEQKLQQAALMFIVTQLVDKEEKEELQQTFLALDKNADGHLSREELIGGYTQLYGSREQAIREVNNLMEKVDVDRNGFIDYSEFLIASTNKKKVLSKENLRRAFELFDKDGNGTISPEEIRLIIGVGKKFSEEVWAKVISEVDKNKDGEISFEEFEFMMLKFLEQ